MWAPRQFTKKRAQRRFEIIKTNSYERFLDLPITTHIKRSENGQHAPQQLGQEEWTDGGWRCGEISLIATERARG